MKFIFSLFVFFSTFFVYFCSDKIKLSEVATLTLYSNKKTNGRRSAGVPQLECVGGSLNCNEIYLPNVVQCKNVGIDEYDVQWSCKAELATSVKFGHIDISCEGYDYPNDKYILKGSCGLRYTLDGSGSHQNSRSFNKDKTIVSDNSFNNMMMVILIVAVIVIIVCWYNSNSSEGSSRVHPSCPPPPGFRPEFTSNQNSTNYCEPPSYSSVFNEPKTSYHRTESSGPGFWTGLGTGGIMGYMFGSNSRQRNYEPMPNYSGETRYVNEDRFSRPRSKSPEFRTASGFGGTSRR